MLNTLEQLFQHGMPGSTVLRLQGVDTKGGSRGYVVRPVVDKDSLVGKRMLASKHHFVDASVRLHHAHLITEVESVKVVLNAAGSKALLRAHCIMNGLVLLSRLTR